MSKHKALFKKIGLYLMISLAVITVIMGVSFWGNSMKPTYERVPYTVEEARVYVTNYGDCYHSSDCSYLHSSRNAIGKNKARSQGYYACSRCNGIPSGTIEETYYQLVEKDMTSEIVWGSIVGGFIVSAIIYVLIPKEEKEV